MSEEESYSRPAKRRRLNPGRNSPAVATEVFVDLTSIPSSSVSDTVSHKDASSSIPAVASAEIVSSDDDDRGGSSRSTSSAASKPRSRPSVEIIDEESDEIDDEEDEDEDEPEQDEEMVDTGNWPEEEQEEEEEEEEEEEDDEKDLDTTQSSPRDGSVSIASPRKKKKKKKVKEVHHKPLTSEELEFKSELEHHVRQHYAHRRTEACDFWSSQRQKWKDTRRKIYQNQDNAVCLPFACDEAIQDDNTALLAGQDTLDLEGGESRYSILKITGHCTGIRVHTVETEDAGYLGQDDSSSSDSEDESAAAESEHKEKPSYELKQITVDESGIKQETYSSEDAKSQKMEVDASQPTQKNAPKDNNGKPKRRISEVIASRVVPLTMHSAPIPKSSAYISVNRNHFVKDDKKLRYIPYFDDNDLIHKETIAALYSDCTQSDTEAEEISDVRLQYIENISDSEKREAAVESYLKVYRIRRNVYNHRRNQLNHVRTKALSQQKVALHRQGWDTKNLDIPLDSFQLLFCPRCGTYDCSVHGVANPTRNDRSIPPVSKLRDNPDPFNTINKCLEDPNALATTEGNHSVVNDFLPYYLPESYKPSITYPNDLSQLQPCSSTCYLDYLKKDESERDEVSGIWDEFDESLLRTLVPICRKNFCQMADIIGRTKHSCQEIYLKIKEWIPDVQPYTQSVDETEQKTDDSHPKQKKRKTVKPRKRAHRQQAVVLGEGEPPSQYRPCNHSGPCTAENCTCIQKKTYCEKFCCCPPECSQRHTGCQCKTGRCGTQACPCFVALRECDPDKCRNCQSHLTPLVMQQAVEWLQVFEEKQKLAPPDATVTQIIEQDEFLSAACTSIAEDEFSKLTISRSRSSSNSRELPRNRPARSNSRSSSVTRGGVKADKMEKDSDDEENEDIDMTTTAANNSDNRAPTKATPKKKDVRIEILGVPNINPFTLCKNIACTHQHKKKLWVGKSRIHGFGCFAGEPIPKGSYITEYLGELISHEEADRRGKVYDKLDLSYLFDLNSDLVVDATRKGNKLKFANHSKRSDNCGPKIMTTNGDHRICMYAKKDLKVGEELFFDYGHGNGEHTVKPSWFKE